MFKKLIMACVIAGMTLQPVYAAGTYESRTDIPAEYKWDLTDIYASQADFEADLKRYERDYLPKIAAFEGTLNNKQSVLDCLRVSSEGDKILERALLYTYLNRDLDLADAKAQELLGRFDAVNQKSFDASAFITPELSLLSDEELLAFIADPDFSEFKSSLEYIVKDRPHLPTDAESEMLARLGMLSSAPTDIFTMINDVDVSFEPVTDANGNVYEVTHGNYSMLMQNPDRELRKAVYQSYREAYLSLNNTIAAVLSAEVNKNILYAETLDYDSALEASLGSDIPVSVYENLITATNKNLAPLHRYYSLRANALGFEKRLPYDAYLPLVPEQNITVTYDEAREMVLEALAPLGGDYTAMLETAFSNRWIDVYETPNKATGAYMLSVYEPHPYVLLNFAGQIYDASTLAHELGHAMHQNMSNLSQSHLDAATVPFTAEVASTVNEIIFNKYLVEHAQTNAEKLYYLTELADLYSSTFYGQVMFAEFEKDIYEIAEAGGVLNAETLNSKWLELTAKYNGESYQATDYSKTGWSDIPHFYMNFYVYQYATSIAAANQLAGGIIEGQQGAVENYRHFCHPVRQRIPSPHLPWQAWI